MVNGRNMASLRKAVKLIGPAILIVILSTTDLSALGDAIRVTSGVPLLLALIVLVPTIPLRSLRWFTLLKAQGRMEEIRLIPAINAYAFSILVGTPTPGRIGEFVKVAFLKTNGAPVGAAFSSVMLDRLYDVYFLVLVGCASFFLLQTPNHGQSIVLIILLILVPSSVIALYLATRPGGQNLVSGFIKAFTPERFSQTGVRVYADFAVAIQAIGVRRHIGAFILTTVAWMLNFLASYFCAKALGLGLSYFQICAVSSLSTLVTLIPVSFMGVGTRDASLVFLLSIYGIGQASAIALSILTLGLVLWVCLVSSYSLLTPQGTIDWQSAQAADGGTNE